MMSTYACTAADPPWPETGGGRIKRGADRWYELVRKSTCVADVLRIMLQAPCWRPAANSHLWLWVTNNYLPQGLQVMVGLGFRYVTNVAWGKAEHKPIYRTDCDGFVDAWAPQRPGLGQYIAGQHELLLFGVRGRLPARWKGFDAEQAADPNDCPKRQGTLVLAPRGKHSEKPAEAYELIRNVSPGPRLEMFARGPRDVGTFGETKHELH